MPGRTDNDGFLDLYLGNFNGSKTMLHNDGNDNHWIVIKPQGVTNNTAGIGARIRVVAGDLSMIRDIQAGAGAMTNGYIWGYFGLGNATKAATNVDSVIVTWPNGDVDVSTDVPADKYYTFVEGVGVITGVEDRRDNIPARYALGQNYPNPFNPTTTISFTLPERADVRLVLVNTLGQVVKEIAVGKYNAGTHEVGLDASDLASGIYFYRLEANEFNSVRKLVLLK